MNFKPSTRPHQPNPYSQSSNDFYPYRIMIPKKINHHSDQPNSRQLTPLKKACSRCNSKQATTQCNQCSKSILCPNCDINLHTIGKFQAHRRISLIQAANSGQLSEEISRSNLHTEQNNFQTEIVVSTKISISQTWDNIISEVSQKFKQAIDSMKDKRKQILDKIERKRDQDIKNYQTSSVLYTENKKCAKRASLEYLPCNSQISSKLLTLNSEEMEQKVDKKYKASFTVLEQIQGLIDKIQIKNILVRVLEQPIPTGKKSMKRSLIVTPSTSLAYSPGTKTPAHTKQLSQSTIQADPIQFGYKLSMETKKKLFDPQKQAKLLSKIKSQKLLCKSPTNMSKYIKDKPTVKKGIKQGQ